MLDEQSRTSFFSTAIFAERVQRQKVEWNDTRAQTVAYDIQRNLRINSALAISYDVEEDEEDYDEDEEDGLLYEVKC